MSHIQKNILKCFNVSPGRETDLQLSLAFYGRGEVKAMKLA